MSDKPVQEPPIDVKKEKNTRIISPDSNSNTATDNAIEELTPPAVRKRGFE